MYDHEESLLYYEASDGGEPQFSSHCSLCYQEPRV